MAVRNVAHGGRGIMGPALGETATPFPWNRTQDRFPRTAREITMRRREFIAGLGAAITGSIRTNAQQLPPVSLVGYLYAGPAEGFAFRQVAFRKGLAETDYFEGCNVAIETHWARNE